MGFGLSTFYYFSQLYNVFAFLLAVSLFLFMLFLYIMDISYWNSKIGQWTRALCLFLAITGVGTLLLFISGNYPYGPIALFTVTMPLWLILARFLFFRSIHMRIFVSWLGAPLFLVSLLVFCSWVTWTFWDEENSWDLLTRLTEADETGCVPDFTDNEDCKASDSNSQEVCFYVVESAIVFPEGCDLTCTSVYNNCLNTFVIWVGPLLVSVSLLFLSFFASFLSSDSSERDAVNFSRLWVCLLFGLWVAASLAGVGAGVFTTLAALTMAAFVACVIFLLLSFDQAERDERMNILVSKMTEKYGNYVDIFRGLLVVTTAPIAAICLFLSVIKQGIRKLDPAPCIFHPDDKVNREHDADHLTNCVTSEADRHIRFFLSWDRSKVYKYAVYWGIAFMALNVLVAKFTLLFLSWLIQQTSAMSLASVTGIMTGVGIVMFLLPPVPGVPIYLALGIVVLAVGRDTMGIVGSVAYASLASLVIKLVSVALQQKMFGAWLKNYVSVRKFVAINSTLTRAMRLVLGEKGLSVAKCAILVGGPDWPTSTMCGIMDLPLLPVQVGTLPVIFLILPTVMTGTFTYMSSLRIDGQPEFSWAGTLAAIFAATTAIVQFGAMVIAVFYLERIIETRHEELNTIPIDDEVKVAEEKDLILEKAYTEITKWCVVPLWAKCVLTTSLVLMISCCYMVQLFQGHCFAEYSLTYTIDENLNGEWTNIVLPLGFVAILLFASSIILLALFTTWASVRLSSIHHDLFVLVAMYNVVLARLGRV